MVGCVDELAADCRHYYGVDITTLWAHQAAPLIWKLPDLWDVTGTDPPRVRSAVYAALSATESGRVSTTAELSAAGVVFEEV